MLSRHKAGPACLLATPRLFCDRFDLRLLSPLFLSMQREPRFLSTTYTSNPRSLMTVGPRSFLFLCSFCTFSRGSEKRIAFPSEPALRTDKHYVHCPRVSVQCFSMFCHLVLLVSAMFPVLVRLCGSGLPCMETENGCNAIWKVTVYSTFVDLC